MSFHKINLPELRLAKTNYSLPILNDCVEICQGYNGEYSHCAIEFRGEGERRFYHDDRYSLDFSVPYGSSVFASKAGIVKASARIHSKFYEGTDLSIGVKLWTNKVLLAHEDNTYTLYSHLATNGVKVNRGNLVKVGQEIAVTGKSGWVGPTPHLHFAALKFSPENSTCYRRTFPIKFKDYSGDLHQSDIDLENIILCGFGG